VVSIHIGITIHFFFGFDLTALWHCDTLIEGTACQWGLAVHERAGSGEVPSRAREQAATGNAQWEKQAVFLNTEDTEESRVDCMKRLTLVSNVLPLRSSVLPTIHFFARRKDSSSCFSQGRLSFALPVSPCLPFSASPRLRVRQAYWLRVINRATRRSNHVTKRFNHVTKRFNHATREDQSCDKTFQKLTAFRAGVSLITSFQ